MNVSDTSANKIMSQQLKFERQLGEQAVALDKAVAEPGVLKPVDLIKQKITETLNQIKEGIEQTKNNTEITKDVKTKIEDRWKFIQMVATDLFVEAKRLEAAAKYYDKIFEQWDKDRKDPSLLSFRDSSEVPKLTQEELHKVIIASIKATSGTSFLSPFGTRQALVEKQEEDQIAFTFPHTAKPLGLGGFSTVQEVISLTLSSGLAHVEKLAIKIVNPELKGQKAEGAVAQLENERQKLIILHKKGLGEYFMPVPRIVTWISGQQETQNIKGILTIKYTTTLNDAFQKGGPLSRANIKTRLEICMKMINAIVALKKANIIHGDIKEENIGIIIGEDGSIHIKLADFGGARTTEDLDINNRMLKERRKEKVGGSIGIATEGYYSTGDVIRMVGTEDEWRRTSENWLEINRKGSPTKEESESYRKMYSGLREKYEYYQYRRDLYAMMKVCDYVLTGTSVDSSLSVRDVYPPGEEVTSWLAASVEDDPEQRPSLKKTKRELGYLMLRNNIPNSDLDDRSFAVACKDAIGQGTIEPIKQLLKCGYKLDESDFTTFTNLLIKRSFWSKDIAELSKLLMEKLYAKPPLGQGLIPSKEIFREHAEKGLSTVLEDFIKYGYKVTEEDIKYFASNSNLFELLWAKLYESGEKVEPSQDLLNEIVSKTNSLRIFKLIIGYGYKVKELDFERVFSGIRSSEDLKVLLKNLISLKTTQTKPQFLTQAVEFWPISLVKELMDSGFQANQETLTVALQRLSRDVTMENFELFKQIREKFKLNPTPDNLLQIVEIATEADSVSNENVVKYFVMLINEMPKVDASGNNALKDAVQRISNDGLRKALARFL